MAEYRPSDVPKVAAMHGCETRPGKGSHVNVTRLGAPRPFPISAHNGEKSKVLERFVRQMCATLQIDFDEFKTKL